MFQDWEEIKPGETKIIVSNHEWYRSKSSENQERYILRYDKEKMPSPELPTLQGLHSFIYPESNKTNFIIFQLENHADIDVFDQLFESIIAETNTVANNELAVTSTLAQLLKWQQMLRNKYSPKMNKEEQKGLIGELYILHSLLSPTIASPEEVLNCWTGPTGSPKDFGIGPIALEVKTRRGTSEPFVHISSEHQLDTSDVHDLFLCVVVINEAPSEMRGSFTLIDKIDEVITGYEDSPNSQRKFIELLNSYPHSNHRFNFDDEYVERYTFDGVEFYHVTEEFPKITSAEIPEAVSNVGYRISLSSLPPFVVSETNITKLIANTRGDIGNTRIL